PARFVVAEPARVLDRGLLDVVQVDRVVDVAERVHLVVSHAQADRVLAARRRHGGDYRSVAGGASPLSVAPAGRREGTGRGRTDRPRRRLASGPDGRRRAEVTMGRLRTTSAGGGPVPDAFVRRPFGRTGLEVHPICLGGAPLGSMPEAFAYSVPEAQALATV